MKFYKPALKRTIYLQSNKATTTTNPATSKYNSFTWVIPPIIIDEVAELQVGSIASQNSSATAIYTFRLKTPMGYGNTNFSADGGAPIIFSLILNNYNSMFRNDFGVILSLQSINNISIQVSDDYTNPDAGIATNLNFVLCLVIQEFQVNLQETTNYLQDANDAVKHFNYGYFPQV